MILKYSNIIISSLEQKNPSLKKKKEISKELVIYKLRNDRAVATPWEKHCLAVAADK